MNAVICRQKQFGKFLTTPSRKYCYDNGKLFSNNSRYNRTTNISKKYNLQTQINVPIHNRKYGPAATITTSSLINHQNVYTSSWFDITSVRYYTLTTVRYQQPSSKVEETVKKIQEKEKVQPKIVATTITQSGTSTSNVSPVTTGVANTEVVATKVIVKKTLKQKIWDELVHYYHGFRLLFIDINVARKLLGKVLSGRTLTRREYMLLIRTTGDVFRLVPFSVFIIVPFMEFLLPVFIKFFPGMLPSTFETAKDKEDKARKNLKVKLEMAKFLQKTLDEMDVQNKDHKSDEAKEFIEFFNRLRSEGHRATPEEILKFSKLFEDEITLDSLNHEQLSAICKVLEVSTIGTSNFLRFQLRMKLRTLAADDRMIQKEGVDSLTLDELQAASRARGMRSYGLSKERLRHQILEWINLSLNEKVPPSLLLLSRAMLLPEDVPTAEKLKASISVLSDSAAVQTKAAIGEREGKIDNKTKIDIIRDEERKIKEELDELKEEEKSEAGIVAAKAAAAAEELIDRAPIIGPATTILVSPSAEAIPISSKDIEVVSDALGAIAAQKKTLLVEKEEIKDLKEEIADYKEDVEELNLISKTSSGEKIKESAAAKSLLKKVDSMISKLDKNLDDLEKKEAKLQAAANVKEDETELVHIDEIINAIRKMQKVPDESKVENISKMLGKIDMDKDGQLKVDDVLKVIQTIGKDSVNLNEKHIDELIELITKEERLENEEKIQKALEKSIEERKHSKAMSTSADGSGSHSTRNSLDASLSATTTTTTVTVDPEELTDSTTKTITTDDEVQNKSPAEATTTMTTTTMKKSNETSKQNASKIDEQINKNILLNATEAAERQRDKILSLKNDVATTSTTTTPPPPPPPPSTAGSSSENPKDKML